MNPLERFALTSLTDLLREGKNPQTAREFLVGEVGMDRDLVNHAFDLYQDLAKGVREMRDPRVLVDNANVPQPWYTGPSPKDIHWPALEYYLSSKPAWMGSPIENLDKSSSKVVAYMDPPYADEIRTRGLVIGYVQSGKTSNFTAVMSKAADVGYRLFIVLSGVHNNLRRQTQIRLNEQLIELNRHIWAPLTVLDRDFGSPINATPLLAQPGLRLLAVVKKNGNRLSKLNSWLDRAQEDGVLDHCPILVIDDEADQASPNTAKANEKRRIINGLIIDLLRHPKVAYVGYSATPFANFFIDPKYPEDLYPRDFIVDLPRSEEYFGPESLFGREPKSPDDEVPEPLDMIRVVDSSELSSLIPPAKRGQPFAPAVTDSLRTAIRWFLLAATARRLRAGEPVHTTMLIHTSERVAAHELLWEPIASEILTLRKALASGDTKTLDELSRLWNDEIEKVDPQRWGHQRFAAASVVSGLEQTIALLGNLADRSSEDCGVVVDNSSSPRRLIYDDNNPLPVIVIGGNTLSRGLTLEGLVSSFFVRRAATYDTLLQMGRWFGYRRNYEDLPRMWVTKQLKTDFRFLAGVEQQIRDEIARYEDEQLTPLDIPVRVQTYPGLAITALNKMRATKDLRMSYSGQRPQTIAFVNDQDWLEHNLNVTRELLDRSLQVGTFEDLGNRLIIRDVPVEEITRFLRDDGYKFDEARSELQSSTLLGYIESQNGLGALDTWNIAVISRIAPVFGDLELGLPRKVNLIGRSKLKDASTDRSFNIGILTNQVDWIADLGLANEAGMSLTQMKAERTKSKRGVLLVYPIARNSPARTEKGKSQNDKVDLDAPLDVIGVAIAFPVADMDPTPQKYKVVRLPGLVQPDQSAEAEEELEDEEEYLAALDDDRDDSLDLVELPQA